jgi:hypothetical protein
MNVSVLWVGEVVRRHGGVLQVAYARPAVARLLNAEAVGEPRGGKGGYEPLP